jgi:hypothetical protein
VPAVDKERSGEHQVRKGSNHGRGETGNPPFGTVDAKLLHWTSLDLASLSSSRLDSTGNQLSSSSLAWTREMWIRPTLRVNLGNHILEIGKLTPRARSQLLLAVMISLETQI